MALSNATRLSDFGSGIGTQGAAIKVDNTQNRVGLGTTNPQAMVQVGQNITMDGGASGVITATKFVGDGSSLTGVAATDNINTNNIQVSGMTTFAAGINASGVITATSFEGSGANLTGVSGFGTAINATQGTLGNLIYKTPRSFYIGGATSAYLNSDTTSGGMLFTRLDEIHVASAATVHIGSGTTLVMDVLNIF